MKKLLSILALSGAIGASSSSIVSCSSTDKKNFPNNTTLSFIMSQGNPIYDTIYNILSVNLLNGDQTVFENADAVKADTNIQIQLEDQDGNVVDPAASAASDINYRLYISVSADDKYYNEMPLTQYGIDVLAPPAPFPSASFKLSEINEGAKLYDFVQNAISLQVKDVNGKRVFSSAAEVALDSHVQITITEKGKTDKLPMEAVAKTGETYTVSISVSAGDLFLKQTSSPISVDLVTKS